MKYFAYYADHKSKQVYFYPALQLKTKRGCINRMKRNHEPREDGTQNYGALEIGGIFDNKADQIKQDIKDLLKEYEYINCIEC